MIVNKNTAMLNNFASDSFQSRHLRNFLRIVLYTFQITCIQKIEWSERGKFYPKKVIQIGGVKLSTQISHIIFFYLEELSKDLFDINNNNNNILRYLNRYSLRILIQCYCKLSIVVHVTWSAEIINNITAHKSYYQDFFFGPKTTARKQTTNYFQHPGPAQNNLRDYFRAGLWAGSNHYFLDTIPIFYACLWLGLGWLKIWNEEKLNCN